MNPQPISSDIAGVIERLQGTETLDWEIKAAKGGLPNSIWETISAFANTHGGWLVLGIAERDTTPVIEGISDPESMVRQLHEQMRTPPKISHPVSGAADISIISAGDHRLVAIRVPPVSRRLRPIYTRGNPYGGTYLRRHEGDFRATRPEVDRMMREASDLSGDQVILDGYRWDDFDGPTLQRYRRRFQTAHPDSPHNALADDEFLSVIGGYRRERETGREGITVAGLLMFGKEEAIRAWRGRHMIDFRLVPGDPTGDAQTDWDDRLIWEGNLLGAYEAIMPRLVDGLPTPFGLVDGVRIDQSDRHVALREAFVNLLLHADYSERDTSLVIRSADGYFFRNPGNSRVHDLDPALNDRSDPRNPELVRMFRYIGLAEEAGSGVPRIVGAWRRLGYEVPDFDLGGDRYEFAADLRFRHLLSADDRNWIGLLGLSLSEEEQLALVIARHEGWVDNGSLRRVTGQHPADVTRVLGGLRDMGLLHMVGGGRGAKYLLDATAAELADTPVQESTETSTADSAASTTGLRPGTTDSAETTDRSLSTLVDSPLWLKLELIARPVSSVDYVSAEERNRVVVRLCERADLSLLELAWLLGRNKQYVRSILKQLIDEGSLEYTYPDRPRHPNQKYRAIKTKEER